MCVVCVCVCVVCVCVERESAREREWKRERERERERERREREERERREREREREHACISAANERIQTYDLPDAPGRFKKGSAPPDRNAGMRARVKGSGTSPFGYEAPQASVFLLLN
jgi:hypothetical protein